jgi:glycosyltransferase involved in cell wall biosynthesis
MKILRVIASVDPASGGPVAGLTAMTPALAALGHTTEFATVDDPKSPFLRSGIGPTHALGPATSRYAYSPQFDPWLSENLRHYDAIIVHGLWQYLGRTIRNFSQQASRPPYFIFPHGMLDPGLKRAYPVRHFKKWLYWQVVERRVIRDARAVFFTCDEECRLARLTFPLFRCNAKVVGYGTAAPRGKSDGCAEAWKAQCPSVQGRPYLLYLGRIHSKKGIDLLLRAYARLHQMVSDSHRTALPDLVVAGPSEDPEYLAALKTLAATPEMGGKIHWVGMLQGDAKWGAIKAAEAFVLPSHQENFGIAVVEALACGVPVLVSNRVNIWRELFADSAAMVEADDERGTYRLLERWLSVSTETRQAMSAAALRSFQKRFEISRAAERLAQQLSELVPSS